MKKYLIALPIGLVATLLFAILAGMGGGACHCNTPLRVLFPFLSLAEPDSDGGIVGGLLLWLQFPVYALSVAMPKRAELRGVVLLILLAAHACAVAVASMTGQ
jgi:hypothetical protein